MASFIEIKNSTTLSTTTELTASYKKRFDRHDLSVLVGASQYWWRNEWEMARRDNMSSFTPSLNMGDPATQVNDNAINERATRSLFGRVNYSYDDRYLFEVNVRYDGSSRLAPDHRWAFFPSVSLAWRIDQENFMKNAEFIDQLKPRFSWGKMGNQAVSLYSYLSSVNTSGYDYSFDGTKYGGAAISALADNTITWEETTSYDAGIDFSAFGNRVLFSADWFLKRTEGILRTVNLPSQVGDLSGPKSNVGVVDNKGIELSLTLRDSWGDFSAGISGNFSYTRNEIVDLNGETEINGRLICKEGYPINSWYLLETDGVFQNQSEIDNAQAVYGNRAVEDALLEMSDLCLNRGFTVVGGAEMIAPHSIDKRFGAGRPDASDIAALNKFLASLMAKQELKTVAMPGKRPYREYKGIPVYPTSSSKCSGCGTCAQECPTEAIDPGDPLDRE